MRKDEFFKKAMKADLYKTKKWIITAFSLFKSDGNQNKIPYEIVNIDSEWIFFNPETEAYETITELDGKPSPANKPLFRFTEDIEITGTDIVNNMNPETMKTTYGIFLANYILLVFPFQDKIPYINKEIKISGVEAMISKLLIDDDEPDAKGKIKIAEYKNFVKAVGQLEGLAPLCVPTITEKALTTDPKIKEVVAALKEKYKDRLNDPLVIAMIDAEVAKLDKEWIKGDPSERFYIKSKAFDVTRKKMLGVYGGDAGMGDGTSMTFIDKPLSEGLDLENLPVMFNSLRSGSYDRGTQTALGGVAVKQFFRVFQNCNITQQDCGTKVGIIRIIRKDNQKKFIGFYHLVNGKSVLISEENINDLIGKTIEMRSPAMCKTPLTDYCEICMGVDNSRSKSGLGASAAAIGSNFMKMFLKKMHGTALKITKFNIEDNII